MNYYNDHEPFAAQWLKNLVAAGLLPPGTVDSRDIQEVTADELREFTQCHFFAGIGGWPLALQLAGWPTTRPVWTGSCPCQPFSVAGKGKGIDDHRHIWPEFRRLIADGKPSAVFGEQVASADGRKWLSGVRADLENLGYGVGAADLCAAGVSAPHIRQRLYWVADASDSDGRCGERGTQARTWQDEERGRRLAGGGIDSRLAVSSSAERQRGAESVGECGGTLHTANSGSLGGVGNAIKPGLQRHAGNVSDRHEPGRLDQDEDRSVATTGGNSWSDYIIIPCGDGKARRIKPGITPLVDGIPGRVGLIRGYGNAICPEVGAEFIRAFLAVRP